MPDNRLPTNQSLIDLKDSIDLLTANINRTASNIPYDSNLTIKAAIDGKVSKSGDTMTDTLGIKPSNALGAISLGKGSNSLEYGVVQMFDDASHWLNIMPSHQTDDRMILFPDKTGTLALESDIKIRRVYDYSINTTESINVTLPSGEYKAFFVMLIGGTGSSACAIITYRSSSEAPSIIKLYDPDNVISATTGGTITINRTGWHRTTVFDLSTEH